MYSIKKFVDCWAVFNLDTDESRELTMEECDELKRQIPSISDPMTLSYFTDKLDMLKDLP